MKSCNSCGAIYEDSYDICVSCGCRLVSQQGQAHRFSERDGSATVFHGTVVRAETRQYYQSGFAKVIRAIFAGEPYQLGHTSHITVIRLEERTDDGTAGQAQEVVVYGGVQSILTTGDQVTVRTRRRGARYIATNIFNHTVNSDVRIEGNVAAGVVLSLFLLLLLAIVGVVVFVATIDYEAVGRSFAQLAAGLLPVGAAILIFWYLLRSFFRR